MPPHPERADKIAPKKKESEYRTPSSQVVSDNGLAAYNANSKSTMATTKTETNLYSVKRKARAPDLILSEILFMVSFPLGAWFSCDDTKKER
jgi:hypothetical protein